MEAGNHAGRKSARVAGLIFSLEQAALTLPLIQSGAAFYEG